MCSCAHIHVCVCAYACVYLRMSACHMLYVMCVCVLICVCVCAWFVTYISAAVLARSSERPEARDHRSGERPKHGFQARRWRLLPKGSAGEEGARAEHRHRGLDRSRGRQAQEDRRRACVWQRAGCEREIGDGVRDLCWRGEGSQCEPGMGGTSSAWRMPKPGRGAFRRQGRQHPHPVYPLLFSPNLSVSI